MHDLSLAAESLCCGSRTKALDMLKNDPPEDTSTQQKSNPLQRQPHCSSHEASDPESTSRLPAGEQESSLEQHKKPRPQGKAGTCVLPLST